ncbi:hypothetical protein JCM6882_007703 [Rhodosporidiobolus microsporus]
MPFPPSAYYASPSTAPDPTDDWETAYSREEDSQTEQQKNARLWTDANTLKPTYSILSASSSASMNRSIPSAALNESTTNGPPQLKILRRPTSAASSSSASSSGPPGSRSSSAEGQSRAGKTYAEREKEYQEARRRIYGDEGGKETKSAQESLSKLSLGSGGRSSSGGGQRRAEPRTASPASSNSGSRTRQPRQPPPSSSAAGRNGGSPAPQPSLQGVSVVRAPKGPSEGGGGFGFGGGEGQKSGRGRGR